MNEINGTTKVLGLIGNPVKHTLSPVIHNNLFSLYNYNKVYLPFQLEKQGLQKGILGVYELGFEGLNVTVPHKNNVINYLKEVDKGARAIGAVNTLVRCEGGFKGYNTDMLGLMREIDYYGINLYNREIVVLGAGGASKAVVYMCLLKEAKKIYLLNRTYNKAEEISDSMNKEFNCNKVIPMKLSEYKSLNENKYIVFQTTSIGLSPENDKVIIDDEDFYRKAEIGIDLIYNPEKTRFMEMVESVGNKAYNGLRMLLYQGIIAFELWNNIKVEEKYSEEIYKELCKKIRNINCNEGQNIVLIGYMGSGKSTIGKEISKLLNYSFIDTDKYIEEKTNMRISEIFNSYGEEYFRKLETDIIIELQSKSRKCVFSTGGGMPIREGNAKLLRQLGKVIYLEASADTIYERVKYDTKRPLLQVENPKNKIQEMLREREAFYINASDICISTDKISIEDIINKILNALE